MKNKRQKTNSINSWISISDLMACVLAIFIVFYVIQTILVQKERNEYYSIISKLDLTRENIISDLKNNKEINLNVDSKTGVITLNSEILFESNESKLKNEGKLFLKNFIPKYIEILVGDKEIEKYLKQIVVEGHTDKQGSYLYNLNLSQKRALSVVEYINGKEIGEFKGKEDMKKYLTASGRSFMDFLGNDNENQDPKSRRVEFKFILKEDKALNELKDVFNKNGGK